MAARFITTVLGVILFTQINLYSQENPYKIYDLEPIGCLEPFYFRSLKKYEPSFKSPNQTTAEYNKEIQDIRRHNDEIDKEYAAYVQDSLEYEACLIEFYPKLAAWRARNPDWRKDSMHKDIVIPNQTASGASETYTVSSATLNLRKGAGTQYEVLKSLRRGDKVQLLNKLDNSWWQVTYQGITGYVYAQYLEQDPYSDWQKQNYTTGVTPECENVSPKFDYSLDNYLRVNVGFNTDVVVKLMKMSPYGDECIRIVYISRGDTYEIKNIPEGKYYLKIAYGTDYRKKMIGQQCYVKFINNAHYTKGKDILDYHKVRQPDKKIGNDVYQNWSIPSYELSLDLIIDKSSGTTFKSNDISESEFNQ